MGVGGAFTVASRGVQAPRQPSRPARQPRGAARVRRRGRGVKATGSGGAAGEGRRREAAGAVALQETTPFTAASPAEMVNHAAHAQRQFKKNLNTYTYTPAPAETGGA